MARPATSGRGPRTRRRANILETLAMTYTGPERRQRSRKAETVATRIIALATGALFLGLLWLGYRVATGIHGR
jgi:hypothetical protein